MPMFREDYLGQQRAAPEHSGPIPMQSSEGMERWLTRRLSEESIRTELCEGPVPDTPPKPSTPEQPSVSHAVSDRAELIERLKRGESPTWVPNRHLESLLHEDKQSSPPRTPLQPGPTSPGLLPPPLITPEKQVVRQVELIADPPFQEGLNIERPRSALHSGNFTPEEQSPGTQTAHDVVRADGESHVCSASGVWIATSPQRDFIPFNLEHGAANYRREAFRSPGPSSLSSSLSSSFVYKPPTSPLVQSESNDDIDLTLPLNSFNIGANSPRNPRRHTVNFSQSPGVNTVSDRQIPLRREGTHPYQAHQPRRSLNSTPMFSFAGSTPQTPAIFRPRRPSFSSDASPLQHASMVGSYEESILRGRMSTTPSKPLDFMAQIGVLGLGKCKASLRCPVHVTLPFSAVFYSYASTSYGRSKIEEGPSPYVGQIDLENGLPNPDDGQRAKRKLQSRYQDRKNAANEEPSAHDGPADMFEDDGVAKSTRPKRRSRSPKAPPGGRYRIPEKGQLQVIIKNQNKTAVKLFLVPYDLAGMEPGTKTFIRQRSYSAGPIIEADTASGNNSLGAADRPTLRYLIHLHICCPSKGRYYLYKSIRVVFANRVPDGKERLRNEVTHPDPRFTPYKPTRVMHPALTGMTANHHNTTTTTTTTTSSSSTVLAVEQAALRRSSAAVAPVFSLAHAQLPPSLLPPPHHHHHHHHNYHHHQKQQHQLFNNSNPFIIHNDNNSTNNPGMPSDQASTATVTAAAPTTPMPGLEMTGSATPTTATTTATAAAAHATLGSYDKLSKGDIGYGGNAFALPPASGSRATAEGLLSKRLRSLGVQQQQQHPGATSNTVDKR
ncbi:Atos-like conserved domain-containing protein [Madurella fahalii]|uniref:Atos-like conserved domain-containing protein n=1 Tax=Madurella fahalii TaxID=1157608 RepID=A0ABQ0GML2_9PEZI